MDKTTPRLAEAHGTWYHVAGHDTGAKRNGLSEEGAASAWGHNIIWTEYMNRIYEQTMLFDFYGELLTEHQRRVYEDVVYQDMSLGEIAEELGISRQGVHDLIRRCDKILQGYESKLHLVERFAAAKETVRRIERLTDQGKGDMGISERLQTISQLSRELLEEL